MIGGGGELGSDSDSDSGRGDETSNVNQDKAVSSLETARDYVRYLPEYNGLKIRRLERQKYKMITHIQAQRAKITSERLELEAKYISLNPKAQE
jgi:hypothetical protein